MRATPNTLIALIVFAFAAACGPGRDLDRNTAARLISEHLTAVTPELLGERLVSVAVMEITQPDEHHREARFRWALTNHSGEVPTVDTAGPYTITFRRSDRGWSIAAYGVRLVEEIALYVSLEWSTHYFDLLEVLRDLHNPAWEWDFERKWSASRYSDLPGIPYAVLAEHAKTLTIPETIEWGIFDDGTGGTSRILWVRDAHDTAAVCGLPIGNRDLMPFEFRLAREYNPYCKGRGVIYLGTDTDSIVLDLIAKNGGVLIP